MLNAEYSEYAPRVEVIKWPTTVRIVVTLHTLRGLFRYQKELNVWSDVYDKTREDVEYLWQELPLKMLCYLNDSRQIWDLNGPYLEKKYDIGNWQ